MARNAFEKRSADRDNAKDVARVNLNQHLKTVTAMQSGVGDAGGGGTINQPEVDPETGDWIEQPRRWRVGDKVAQYPLR